MLINLRNALMAGKRIPYDAEVEYLESTGTQCIDTGIYPTTMMRWSVDIQFIGSANFMAMGSIYAGTPRERFIIGREGNDRLNISYGALDNVTSITSQGVRHTMVLDAKNLSWSIDGTSGTFAEASIPNIARIFLFARNRASTKTGISLDAYCINTRVYSCKIWQNGVLVRDYIPVRVGQVGYLYDRVSGKLFGNAGTGDFVVGPDVVPVEYLQSTGTQYIDTGIDCTADFYATSPKVEGQFYSLSSTNAEYYYGCASAWNNGFSLSANIGNHFYQPTWGGYRLLDNMYINDLMTITHSVDGVTVVTENSGTRTGAAFDTTPTQYGDSWLFGVGNRQVKSSNLRCFYFKIYSNGTITRSFIPVRVGTDATSWEGAMMDVLTRRIYRNAGTGAFSYGNDLKNPIPA